MQEIGRRIVNKFLSGRFLAFIMITLTLCMAVNKSMDAVLGISKCDPAIKDLVEKVAMFILGSFVTIVTGVYKEYFDRNDRGNNKPT
jgi:hypothetical protein